MVIRVVVADDHKLVRRSIRTLLKSAADIELVGEAENGLEAVELVERIQPDLSIMDISMPRLDGISATKRIQELALPTHVLILSLFDNQTLVQQALRIGARGYILKRALSTDLLMAIRRVKQGEIFLSQGLEDG